MKLVGANRRAIGAEASRLLDDELKKIRKFTKRDVRILIALHVMQYAGLKDLSRTR